MQPGDVIAQRYRLERLLGAGGMGEVWAATHDVTKKHVALKFLHAREDSVRVDLDARSPIETAKRRILREARAACAVAHPAVVSVHDVVEADDGSPVLVMDLLDGESLRARLERTKRLSLSETIRIAKEVLSALEVAHAAGIVHRDLKPDNLFLLARGDVKILDFGVAKLVGKEGPLAASGTLTATGAMVGTPYYMAPEQAFGEEIDGRADLWAVGVVMYECLVGEPPTKGENLGQVLRLLTTGNLPSLLERAPGLGEDVGVVVGKLLAVDAIDRFASAREALDAVIALDAGDRQAIASIKPPSRASESRTPPAEVITADGNMTATAASRARPRERAWLPIAATIAIAAAATAIGVALSRGATPPPTANAAPPRAPDVTGTAIAAEPPSATSASSPAPQSSSSAVQARAATSPKRAPASSATATPAPASTAAPSDKLLDRVPF